MPSRAKVNAFIEAADDLLSHQQAELLRLGLTGKNREFAEAYIQSRLELLYALAPKKLVRKAG